QQRPPQQQPPTKCSKPLSSSSARYVPPDLIDLCDVAPDGIEWITYASSCTIGLNRLAESVAKQGIPLTVIGHGKGWRGWGLRLRRIHDYLVSVPDQRIVILTDADDVFLSPGCSARDLVTTFTTDFSTPIVFGAEKACFPDPHTWPLYKDPAKDGGKETPFKYPNAGGYIGRAGAVRELLRKTYHNDCQDDQRTIQQAHLANVSYYYEEGEGYVLYDKHDTPYLNAASWTSPDGTWDDSSSTSTPRPTRSELSRLSPLTSLDWYQTLFMNLWDVSISDLHVDKRRGRVKEFQVNGNGCILHQSGPKEVNRVIEELAGEFGFPYDREAVATARRNRGYQ
ncbi:Procollagen-lysine,2-oxoglutarate 5-dioxygenase 2, partial [Quaeritorhiza haematococci]